MTPRPTRAQALFAPLALALVAGWACPPARAADRVEFNRDVRPILSDNCFACHGPDSGHRKAGLRLDTEEGLFTARKGVLPIAKGKLQGSAVWDRVVSDDPDEVMPPPDSHKKLTPAQKDVLKRWIEQGAPWQPHWSFVPLARPAVPAVPAVKDKGWVRTPVDAFVLAKLHEKGLAPAPEADRRTLARRLSFDLLGLPPDPAEVEAFVADTSPGAYERLVDRWMARPQWGEHRGRYWLDAARYGDTHGIHNDNYREMWPYRDWVIAAFNRDLPFDRFVTEQLAGDLLPGRTLETQIASGFHRCNITTSEGGSIPEEVQAIYDKDRVETTGAVFLGLTTGCASCHDHKFDPIAQKDFYALAAFFRNTTQPAMDGNAPDTPPIVTVPTEGDRPRWERLVREQAELAADLKREREAARTDIDRWLAGEWDHSPAALEEGVLLKLYEPGEGKVNGMVPGAAAAWEHPGGHQEVYDLPAGVTGGEGPPDGPGRALRFAAKTPFEIRHVPTATDDSFSVGGWVFVPPGEGSFAVASGFDPAAKAFAPAWTLSVETRVPTVRLFGTGGEKIEVRGNSSARPASGKWVHLFVTYDGSRHPSGVVLYVDGKAEYPDYAADSKPLGGPPARATAIRLGGDGKRDLKGGGLADARVYDRPVLSDEVRLIARRGTIKRSLKKEPAKLTPAERDDLVLLRLMSEPAWYRTDLSRLATVEAEQRQVRKRSPVTHVMAERPNTPAKARLLFRGQYDQPREELVAGTPAALHPYKPDYPRNRLGLAWWVIDPANPLTARVTVNRFWQELFGTGLVRTSEDFGLMGENPSHPELLDWLAVEFRSPADGSPGWDVKRFYKLLVTSAAYRQSAAATPEKLSADPQNRLLSRGPRFRMDAEVLRDMALASSGLLAGKIGGPSVKPYQPPGVWEAVAMFGSNTRFYKPDAGEALYRRSLYTFWKRSAPPASMDLFNAPTREVCTVRRERTNTPLQALVTMNDPQWVEAARRLAERALTEAGAGFDGRLDVVTRRVLGRAMDADERAVCRSALDDYEATYARDAAAAKKLVATGESKPDPKFPPADLAAWTMLVSQVMNTDEALNK